MKQAKQKMCAEKELFQTFLTTERTAESDAHDSSSQQLWTGIQNVEHVCEDTDFSDTQGNVVL